MVVRWNRKKIFVLIFCLFSQRFKIERFIVVIEVTDCDSNPCKSQSTQSKVWSSHCKFMSYNQRVF